MKTILVLIMAAAGTAAALAWQGHSHDHSSGKGVTITGQVVDTACFVGHGTSGPKHAKCAETCARAGNPLAIYDEAGKQLYLPVSMNHKNPNEKLMPFIEKKVKVTGNILEKAGIKGIAIEKVEAAE